MTATDKLRRLLDEYGVKWDYGIAGATTTRFTVNGVDLSFTPMRDGLVCSTILNPAQAIAATLGRSNVGRYVGLRQGEYWERTENSDYYCGGCGWKVTDHDSYCPECGGALHKATLWRGMLTADDVRDLIERHSDASGGNGRDFHNGAYVAIADELNATLGSCNCSNNCTNSERTETCRNISKIVDKYGQARFACSECGAWLDSRMLWNPECSNGESPWVKDCKLNFCPNCGARIVDPTTNDVDAEVGA